MKLNASASYLGRQQPRPASPPRTKFSQPQTFEPDDLNRISLEEINKELDSNINEIILLLNRRKSLILNKKRRLREEFQNKLQDLKRYAPEDFQADLNRATDDAHIHQLMSQKNLNKMSNMYRDISLQERKSYELNRSQEFWTYNKNIESEIDGLLKRLKYYDQELEKDNAEIHEICRQLDQVDESIKDILVSKSDSHVSRAEPLFANKQKQQAILNGKLNQRNKLKDEKMNLIYKIIEELLKLRGFREERLNKLNVVFGDDDYSTAEPQTSKLQTYIDFVDQLENVAKMKEMINQLDQQEQNIMSELERIFRDNDQIFNDLIRKQSEEAKLFNDWTENLKKKLRYLKGNEYFFVVTQLPDIQQNDMKDMMKKFRENLVFLKPLVEEDSTIRQGLLKTNETVQTFKAILLAIQNEKERRRELLNILDYCARLRCEEDLKTEQLRNVELEVSKKNQQKRNLEEDLDGVLGDADLNTFKKIEQTLHDYDVELQHQNQQKRKIVKELEDINSDVIKQLAHIKDDYDDILREILPTNWMNTYDLKKLTDLKHMKNYLKKTFKRFGIISD